MVQTLKDGGAETDISSANINLLLNALDSIEEIPGVVAQIKDLKSWQQSQIQSVALNDLKSLVQTSSLKPDPTELRFILSYARSPYPEEVQCVLPMFLANLVQDLVLKVGSSAQICFNVMLEHLIQGHSSPFTVPL